MRPVLLLVFAATLLADTRTVTKTTIDGHERITTEYEQGDDRRIEVNEGKRREVTIIVGQEKAYRLDMKSHTFVEFVYPARGAKPVETYKSGKKVNIFLEVVDTGEHRELFGRTAQHLILRTRTVPEPGACTQSSHSERDGWFITKIGPKPNYRYHLFGSNMQMREGKLCVDEKVFHGSFPTVVVASEKLGDIITELLEFSEAPLNKSLFAVPENFQKVAALPSDGQW